MTVAGLLMAAGAGSRFGGCKQLAMIKGKPLIRHGLEQLVAIAGLETFTVLGAYREDIIPYVTDLTTVIVNPDWEQGLGCSIATGVRKIKQLERYDAVMIALADQYRLQEQDYSRLIHRFDGSRVVAADYAGVPGVPAIFPHFLFDRLCELDGDRGAKQILVNMLTDVETLPLTSAFDDIDTVSDLGDIAWTGSPPGDDGE